MDALLARGELLGRGELLAERKACGALVAAGRNDRPPVYDLEMRLIVPLLFVIALSAQPPQDTPKKGGGGGRAPQNLKVLKEGTNLRVVMGSFATGLGVKCDYCHVLPNMASDENPKKDIARYMIVMVQQINGSFGDDKEHVTCYTCHRGATMPLTAAPAPAAPGQ